MSNWAKRGKRFVNYAIRGFKDNKMKEEKNTASSSSTSPSSSLSCEMALSGTAESEAQIMLQNINGDYLKQYYKFYSSENDKTEKVLLEFEENLTRLIYRIDDVEPINNQIKQSRTKLIKTINEMIDVIRKTNKKVAVDEVESNGLNFKEILPNKIETIPILVKEEPMEFDNTDNIECSDGDYIFNNFMPKKVMVSSENGVIYTEEKAAKESSEAPIPLQLLHMNTETGLFELDEAAVKSVLLRPEVKNRKIAIVSIVGAFRRGKSFLLNFMLRYLYAQCSPDWLEQSNKLEGFSWRGGMNRDTTGILMWPQPFLVGDDLALVLLDTQGTFDNQTSMKENSFIFALSTLLSSVQIYNLHERIQMDDLSNLQYFLEFGRMVQNASNSKVFENLIFLIRDWNFSDERDFGFEGGQELLNDWLSTDRESVTNHHSELINTCFKQIGCFLMPHPGIEVTKRQFTGLLQDINPNFLKYLKHFIESIFTEGVLSGKQIGGEFVNAEQFLMYMTTFVDKLQHPDIEPRTLYQSMCDTSHSQVVTQCKESYMREMQRAVREVTCDIQAAHRHAVDTALALYASTPKFGAVYDNNLYKKKLVQILEESCERFAHEFDHQTEFKLHKACTDAYDTFQATLNAFCMQLQPECSLEDKYKESCKQAVETIDNMNWKVSQEKMNKEIESLLKKMETFFKIQEPSYRARQEHEKQVRKNLIKQDVLHCYQTMMDIHCGGPDIVPQFDTVHDKAHLKALDILNSAVYNYKLHGSSDFIADINKEMDKMYERYRSNNQRKIAKEKEDTFNYQMLETHHQAVETYRREMDAECGGMKTAINVRQAHEEAFQNAQHLYTSHIEQYGKRACQPHITKTNKLIRQLQTKYTSANSEKLQENTFERAGELHKIGWQYYEEKMKDLNIGIEPVKNLKEVHKQIKADALEKLQPLSGTRFYKRRKKLLEQEIDDKFKLYTQQNNKGVQQTKLDEVKHAQEHCVSFYTERMDALKMDQHPVKNLSEKHDSIKEDALAELDDFFDDVDSQVLQNVKKEIDKKWEIYKSKNRKMIEMFQNVELRSLKCAYNEMKAEYVTNMSKNMNACLNTKNMTHLFIFHEKEKTSALSNFKKITRECEEDNRDEFVEKLVEAIQEAFEDIEESFGKSLRVLRIKEQELKSGSKKNYAIGIDLGTTNSCAAVYRNGKVEMIYSDKLSDKNKTTTPSVVYFGENEILFGETAVVKGFVDPKNCISEMKRIIGRRYNDPVVQSVIEDWPFDVSNFNGMPVVNVNYKAKKSYKPEEVSSLVLVEMKRIAEVYLGSQVHDAVVTIPAYFNGLQREATKAACVKAGLNVLRMINEPTAAAIAFGLQCKSETSKTILVFDFGGGTCDISIVAIDGQKFTVKASKGDNKLGGEDFDDRLTEYVTKIIEAKYNVKIDVKEKRRLRHNCERVKRNLTQNTKYVLQIEQFTDAKVDVEVHVSREKFEELNTYLFHRMLYPIRQCLTEAKLSVEQIDEVVLVGGSSRIPKIRQILREYFSGKKMNVNINPDEAIAYGAAIQAAICTEEYIGNIDISEITPISLGVEVKGEDMDIIIPKNTKIPCTKSMTYVTSHDYQNALQFNVYQGECNKNKGNTLLGEFLLEGITLAPQGKTAATVTFRVDADGILHVKAVERGKENNQKSITITKKVL